MPSLHPSSPPLRGPIRAPGTITAIHSRRLISVRMPNGFESLAHWPSPAPPPQDSWSPGALVELEFNPYNMAQARILPDRH